MTEVKQKLQNHATIPDNPFKDERINWLRKKVETTLEVEYEQSKQTPTILQPSSASPTDIPESPEFFSDCLLRNSKENLQKLMDFLEDTDHGAAVLFWAQKQVLYHERVIQVQVPNEELVVVEKPEETPNIEIADVGSESITQNPPSTTIPETETIVYETIILKMAIGIMPEDLVDTNAIFFLKNHPGPIPVPGSNSIVY
jgi:hypothetical protein